MCGIAGLVDLHGRGRADLARVRRMCDTIRHRGPDGDGFYAPDTGNVALGMRRLSIIDVAGSDQPLYNEDRSIALVFNGEIYNYKELRADLIARGHRPHTEGDGETLIHLYEEYGLDLFPRLRGMYAFALWDAPRNRLVLAVDHIGMKPLYIRERDSVLVFASETKALYDQGERAAINPAVLDTYLSFGFMIGDDTLFDGVRRLPPGHALVVENGSSHLHPYWSFPDFTVTERTAHESLTAADVIPRARDLISESVKLHLRSDVPLGLFLSGGIDSAAMLALMSREAGKTGSGVVNNVGEKVKTFTVGYDTGSTHSPDNELIHARKIASHFGADHHERVITADDWWRGFERYVYHHDEPCANPSAVSLLLLAELTAQQVKVVLTGLGGDELFGGYVNHRAIPQLIQRQAAWGSLAKPLAGLIGALEPFYPAMKRYRGIGALPTYLPRLRNVAFERDEAVRRLQSFDGLVMSDTLRRKLYSPALMSAWRDSQHKERTFATIMARSIRPAESADPYDSAQAIVINTWLTGNALLHCDKVTMAHSLEARVPFFDPALLEFSARVPSNIRMQSNKYVLREAMRPMLPDFALERPKQPFSTPILHWFEHDLSARIQAILLDDGAFIREWFKREALENLLRDHFSGRAPQVEVVFRLLTLEMWGKTFVC